MTDKVAQALEFRILDLLNHIEDVVSDEDWKKIDADKWNAVTAALHKEPSREGTPRTDAEKAATKYFRESSYADCKEHRDIFYAGVAAAQSEAAALRDRVEKLAEEKAEQGRNACALFDECKRLQARVAELENGREGWQLVPKELPHEAADTVHKKWEGKILRYPLHFLWKDILEALSAQKDQP